MKLVDILARELKAWPNNFDYVLQQPLGKVFGVAPDQMATCFLVTDKASDWLTARVTRSEWQAAVDALNAPKSEVLEVDWSKAPEDATHAGVFNGKFSCWYRFDGDLVWRYMSGISGAWERVAQNQPISILTVRPIKPEWSEDGLPNVGTKCVVHRGSHGLHADADKFIGPVVTITARFKSARGIEMACVDSGGDGGCHVFRADMCFHLPTEEEIAAEERKKAIQSMRDEIGYLRPQLGPCPVEKLYDANYRKQVTK